LGAEIVIKLHAKLHHICSNQAIIRVGFMVGSINISARYLIIFKVRSSQISFILLCINIFGIKTEVRERFVHVTMQLTGRYNFFCFKNVRQVHFFYYLRNEFRKIYFTILSKFKSSVVQFPFYDSSRLPL
jgi:hypothetical protein